MMAVTRLFLRRLAAEWKYQYQVLHTAVDWIVALYIVIPFLALFVYSYLSWWRQIPGWFAYIPLNALLGIVLFYAWSGTMRIFLEEADQLFLLQRKTWIKRIFMYSLGYSLLYNLVVTSLLLIILAPFLCLHYGFSLREIILLTLLVFILKNCLGIGRQLLEFRFKGWVQVVMRSVVFIIMGLYVRASVTMLLSQRSLFYLSVLLLIIALGILLCRRMSVQGTFFEDVLRERQAKLKLANIFLMQAGTYVKKPRVIRKRPLLFRNSNLLFKERSQVNGLVEMCLKAVLRNEKELSFYGKLLGVYLVLILAFPGFYKWLLWIVFSIMLTNAMGISWLEVSNAPFVCFFPWPIEIKREAARKAIFLLALPGELILGLVIALQTHSWQSALGMIPIGLAIGLITAFRVALKT